MQRTWAGALLGLVPLLLLVAAGCSSPAPRAGAGTPRPGPSRAPTKAGRLIVENDSEAVVFRVRFAAADQAGFGADRLAAGEVIARGHRRSWEVPPGTYRVQVQFSDGSTLGGEGAYAVRSGGEAVCKVSPAPRAAARGTLTIHNATPFAVVHVYFSRTTQMSWGKDRLGRTELIPAGGRHSWRLPAGSYNLRVVFQDRSGQESPAPVEVVPGRAATFTVRSPR